MNLRSMSSSTPHAPRPNKLAVLLRLEMSPTLHHDTTSVFHDVQPAAAQDLCQPHQNVPIHTIVMQPFRRKRRRSRKLPSCVPPLDLSPFNQPDELMAPVEVLATATSSYMSWGNLHRQIIDSANSKHDLLQASPVEPLSPTMSSQIPSAHKTTRLELVESKMLSNERARTTLQDKREVSIPQVSCSKCLRFEARVATQNGRDVYRDLCGFYFLADGSITIYEFRQFGKRSSALPLIQRGVYYHCMQCRKGQQYEINYITKGATLHFDCQSQPSLPPSLTKRRLLHIRVTYVDEIMKRQLLCEGCNPVQCQQVEKYLSFPFTLIGLKEDNLLRTLQGMFRSRLHGRACKTIVGLGRQLYAISEEGAVSFLQLQLSLRKYHISLTVEDMQQFWQLLCKTEIFCEDSGGVYLDCCLQALTGALSEDRQGIVRQVFLRIDNRKSGEVDVAQMKKFYITKVNATSSLWSEMLHVLCLSDKQVSISFADFENFFHGLSVELSSDSKFYNLMKTHWGI